MSHQSLKNLLEILEREPALRGELERAGVKNEAQLATAFEDLGARVGVAIGPKDLQALLASVNALQRGSTELLDDELERVSGGGDAQLANIDLQNVLQQQQQTLQMLSTLSKTLNDTSMALIRKIGG